MQANSRILIPKQGKEANEARVLIYLSLQREYWSQFTQACSTHWRFKEIVIVEEGGFTLMGI
jgi:hypothetical protein